MAFRILLPQPGIEPRPLTVKALSPNHWTAREFPGFLLLTKICFSFPEMREQYRHRSQSWALEPVDLGLKSALIRSSCLTLGKFLNLSELQFPHLKEEEGNRAV